MACKLYLNKAVTHQKTQFWTHVLQEIFPHSWIRIISLQRGEKKESFTQSSLIYTSINIYWSWRKAKYSARQWRSKDETDKIGLRVLAPKVFANFTVFSTSFFPGLRKRKGSPDSLYIFIFVQLKSTSWGPLDPVPSTTSDRIASQAWKGLFSVAER